MLLTENLSVLSIVLEMLHERGIDPVVVFGSKFADDLSYTQVSAVKLITFEAIESGTGSELCKS